MQAAGCSMEQRGADQYSPINQPCLTALPSYVLNPLPSPQFGYYSLLAASMGCRVVAWEPVPYFAAYFKYALLRCSGARTPSTAAAAAGGGGGGDAAGNAEAFTSTHATQLRTANNGGGRSALPRLRCCAALCNKCPAPLPCVPRRNNMTHAVALRDTIAGSEAGELTIQAPLRGAWGAAGVDGNNIEP